MSESKPLEVGMQAPDFTLPNQDEESIHLSGLKGSWVVLYFYPKDNTPGCTIEALEFTQSKSQFESLGAKVFGISKDTVQSHKNFCMKKELSIDLLSDASTEIIQKYGVWKLKKNFGKESMGVIRSTFIIDPEGKVAYQWSNVKVKGHVDAVLDTLKSLQS